MTRRVLPVILAGLLGAAALVVRQTSVQAAAAQTVVLDITGMH